MGSFEGYHPDESIAAAHHEPIPPQARQGGLDRSWLLAQLAGQLGDRGLGIAEQEDPRVQVPEARAFRLAAPVASQDGDEPGSQAGLEGAARTAPAGEHGVESGTIAMDRRVRRKVAIKEETEVCCRGSRRRNQVSIVPGRPHALDAPSLRLVEEWREPVDRHHDASAADWGSQMEQCRQQLEHRFVVCLGFSRESHQQVVVRRDAKLLEPFQELDVLRAGRALAHQAEHVIRKTLDPRLDPSDAGGREGGGVIARDVRLDLIEEPQIET